MSVRVGLCLSVFGFEAASIRSIISIVLLLPVFASFPATLRLCGKRHGVSLADGLGEFRQAVDRQVPVFRQMLAVVKPGLVDGLV